jgi:glycosyltransferase involved in cell wall biosynthesis
MLAPFKGMEILLEVFPRLKVEFPQLQLTIAGEEHPRFPGYAQSIKDRFAGLEGIRWLGKIPSEDVIELFRRAQIVILPYRASTGASSALNQAAAYGRAIVASDLSELRALAYEGNFQIEFFENGNAKSLQDAIRSLLTSPEKRRTQAQNNFRAIQSARIEITCQRYIQAFNRALEKRKSIKRIPIPNIKIESV